MSAPAPGALEHDHPDFQLSFLGKGLAPAQEVGGEPALLGKAGFAPLPTLRGPSACCAASSQIRIAPAKPAVGTASLEELSLKVDCL